MKVENYSYSELTGWSAALPEHLDSENTLIFVFGSPQMKTVNTPWQDLQAVFPLSKMIGCSGSGEIYGGYINDGTLSVAIVKFDKTQIRIVKEKLTSAEKSLEVGTKIAEELDDPQLKGIFVLSEGIGVNGTELVKGLNTVSEGVVITGGLAGDGVDFTNTWTVCNGSIDSSHVVAVGFYGENVDIGFCSRGGWDTFGPERLITRSDKNILYELDGKPALALYKEYLGDRAEGLPSTGLLFPLAIRKDSQDQNELVRTILGVDEEAQSLIFAGDVPVGYLARLMRANFDSLISAAGESATEVINQVGTNDNPMVVLAISCVGRRIIMGERCEEEVMSSLEALPRNAKQLGFYSYGELCPYRNINCDLHNQTMTLTAIGEK